MNGLKFIRTQCNISLSPLAMALGISRQMVSAWENRKKEISPVRLQQLSEYFGIEPEYFRDIDDNQKDEILSKSMFRWGTGEDEFFYIETSYKNKIYALSDFLYPGTFLDPWVILYDITLSLYDQ